MRVVKYDIRYNKHNKRYIVFEVPEKGRWKIKKSFPTEKEAKDWVEAQTKSKPKTKKKKTGKKKK